MEKFISNMLKKRRIEAKLSQEQLVARLVKKVDARVIRRIENNEYLKQICDVLNISIKEANTNEVLSEHCSINVPNVKTGRVLAHLLIHCNHLEYYPDPANQLEFEETLLDGVLLL